MDGTSDGTSIRALHATAGARKRGPAAELADPALRRSRGGGGSTLRPRSAHAPPTLHLACDAHGTSTAFCVTAGHVNECTPLVALLAAVRGGDRTYSTGAIRAWAQRHHIRLTVPERTDQIAQYFSDTT